MSLLNHSALNSQIAAELDDSVQAQKGLGGTIKQKHDWQLWMKFINGQSVLASLGHGYRWEVQEDQEQKLVISVLTEDRKSLQLSEWTREEITFSMLSKRSLWDDNIYYESTLQRHMDTFQTHRVLAYLSNALITMMQSWDSQTFLSMEPLWPKIFWDFEFIFHYCNNTSQCSHDM